GYSSYFVTPALRGKAFAANTLQPWISFGGGFGHFSFSDKLVDGGANTGGNKTSGLLQLGYGLDVKLKETFGLRVAARNFWCVALPCDGVTCIALQRISVVTGGVFWQF